jgi:hypothetical protein
MSVPGFTAEISVYKPATEYRLSARKILSIGAVKPAIIPRSACWRACCWWDPTSGFFECDDGCLNCCRHPSPSTCM